MFVSIVFGASCFVASGAFTTRSERSFGDNWVQVEGTGQTVAISPVRTASDAEVSEVDASIGGGGDNGEGGGEDDGPTTEIGDNETNNGGSSNNNDTSGSGKENNDNTISIGSNLFPSEAVLDMGEVIQLVVVCDTHGSSEDVNKMDTIPFIPKE